MLIRGKNSYVTLFDAENYINTRYLGGSAPRQAWLHMDGNLDRSRLLIRARDMVDALRFPGRKTDTRQVLEFPRNGSKLVPNDIKQAQIELALWLAQAVTDDSSEDFDRAELIARGVTSYSVGDFSESLDGTVAASGAMQCPAAAELLRRFTGGAFRLC
jgi:hypothetical protein